MDPKVRSFESWIFEFLKNWPLEINSLLFLDLEGTLFLIYKQKNPDSFDIFA